VLIGAPALTQRYLLALEAAGRSPRTLGAESTWAGLHALSAYVAPHRRKP
jgi:2-dehydro-3-deoxygalactonokinase